MSAQDAALNYAKPQEYEIANIEVRGTEYLDKSILTSLSGLHTGDKIKIPGEDLSKAIKSLWKQKLFTNINIDIDHISGDKVFLVINVEERPRLRSYSLKGVKNSDQDELRKKLDLRSGSIFTENMRRTAIQTIRNYYIDKGYLNCAVDIKEIIDSNASNSIKLQVLIDKGEVVKIESINFYGNTTMAENQLRSKMKETKQKIKFDLPAIFRFRKNFKTEPYHPKWYEIPGNLSPIRMYQYVSRFANLNFFKASKFKRKEYEDDKKKIIDYYNSKGYRDARIAFDTVYRADEKNLVIDIRIDEGHQYYFRNIYFNGNTKYPDSLLSKIINIHKGEIYNQKALDEKLFSNPNGGDVSSLYMDDGYLFFSVQPTEIKVVGDSIDVELRITEGPQATINEVRIMGNTKTNERVIRRELRTLPGNKFSRSDLIRSQREIINLGYFDPQQLDVVPIPNPEKGTVDIEYRVTEKPSDQLELSAGYGGKYQGFVGTLGVSFTNFSLKNIIDKKAWNPLPSGDGQRLSLRFQSGGRTSQFYTASFTEPWLGGKRPNSLTVAINRTSIYYLTSITDEKPYGHYFATGGTIAFGTRLKKPDDFFTFEAALNYQRYDLENSGFFPGVFTNINRKGVSNNLNLSLTLSRNSLDQILYPKHGSNFSITASATLPYSYMFNSRMNINMATDSGVERYKWVEYFKVRVIAEWYTTLWQNLVFKASAKLGFVGYYNPQIGNSPFERFELGGDGLGTYSTLGREIVRLRGYEVITPAGSTTQLAGASIFNKFSMELRYPISLNPSATIFALVFAEGGNYWQNISDYRPYELKKSVGIGVRVFLPMFGLLGVDYGFPLDKVFNENGTRIDNPKGRAGIILGQEPE
ncbi:MAG: POTRA domain-containing protein [Chitinophagales bacterium]